MTIKILKKNTVLNTVTEVIFYNHQIIQISKGGGKVDIWIRFTHHPLACPMATFIIGIL